MKKLLFTLLLAAMVLPSWAYDFYIVGTAAEGWKESGRSDAYKMTYEDGVFVWTGFLNAGLFKLCKDNTWNRWCASKDEKTPTFGEDETITYHESGDNNNNWILSSSGYYKITLSETANSFRADFLVPAEDEDNCLIGTADQMEEFRKLVNEKGMSGLNAKLTANIDLSAENAHTPIGTEANKYVGTFDGGGHSIKLVINKDAGYQGLFGRATNGAKFKNLIITGIVSGQYSSAALVGEVGAYGESGTIEISNVGIEADVTTSGDNVGAFVGNDWGGTIKLEVDNCYHIGDITGSDYASVMGGWIDPNSTYTNVYHKGNVTQNKVSHDNANKFAHDNRGNCTNCYTTTSGDTEDGLTEGMAEAEVSSGELCYKLNGSTQGGTTWTQTLGIGGTHPIPFNTQRLVYLNNGSDYANMCVVNSEYQLSNAAELMDFSSLVNVGSASLNAKLTADIDMSGVNNYTPIGTSDNMYAGIFDGDGHRIKELKYSSTGSKKGFFSVCGAATIKNLILDSTCEFRMTEDDSGYGNAAFVGACDGSVSGTLTFQNCGNEASVISKVRNAAAFVGANKSSSDCIGIVIKDCYNTGNIGSSDTSISGNENAIICGWNANASLSVTNFYNIGEIGQIDGNKNLARGENSNQNCQFNNCFYTHSGSQGTSLGSTNVKVTSGELCYKLGNGETDGTWTQTIGTDSYPIPFNTQSTVYEVVEDESYSNLTVIDDDDDDKVEIANASDLVQFSAEVNAGNKLLKAQMTNNIDMNGIAYNPIGTDTYRYAGTFDGNGYHIQNLKISSTEKAMGLFHVCGSATIKNLVIDNTCSFESNASGYGGAAFVAIGNLDNNESSGTLTFYNCGNEAKVKGSTTNKAAFVGYNWSTSRNLAISIKNCYNIADISGGAGNCAFIGWNDNKAITITNCYHIGTVSNYDDGNVWARGSGTINVANCYSTQGCSDLTGLESSYSSGKVSSGELCAKLGYGFRQNIGEDGYPNFNATHGFVNQISAAGYSTQYNTYSDVEIPDGIEAFAGVVNTSAGTLTLNAITGKIAKDEPVVLKGPEGLYNFMPTSGASEVGSNDLQGSDGDVAGDGENYYALSTLGGTEPIGFYLVNSGVTIPAGKAYLNTGAGVKGFTFLFDDDATSIEMVNGQSSMVNDNEIYNLAGQRIQKMQKGINIVNGKKIMK